MKRTVTLCGSMSFLEQMKEWQNRLEKHGHRVLAPVLKDFHTIRDQEGNLEKFNEIKRHLTYIHFNKVREADTILALNYDKGSQPNYLGGNTLAEISYAVALNLCHGHSKEIFTVNSIPENSPFHEELLAWGVRQYDGSLES